MWPYKELIDTLLNQPNFAAAVLQVLQDFYDGKALLPPTPPDYNRYPAKKVLFSLMDCGTTAGAVSSALRPDYLTLVQALNPLGPAARSALIELSFEKAGRLFELSGADLTVGDQALIDILTLCAHLQTPAQWPATLQGSPQEAAIKAAATALEASLKTIIASTFESPNHVPGAFVYTGVGALYKPFAIFGDDP